MPKACIQKVTPWGKDPVASVGARAAGAGCVVVSEGDTSNLNPHAEADKVGVAGWTVNSGDRCSSHSFWTSV